MVNVPIVKVGVNATSFAKLGLMEVHPSLTSDVPSPSLSGHPVLSALESPKSKDSHHGIIYPSPSESERLPLAVQAFLPSKRSGIKNAI